MSCFMIACSGLPGETCCSVCARHGGLGCSQPALRSINSCAALKALGVYGEYDAATGPVKHCFEGNSRVHPSGHREHNARGNAVWYNSKNDPNQALCDPEAELAGFSSSTYTREARRFCPCRRYESGGHEGTTTAATQTTVVAGGPYCPKPQPLGRSTTCPPTPKGSAKVDFTVTMDPNAGPVNLKL